MRHRRPFSAIAFALVAICVGSFALAQQPKKGGAKPPRAKPPAAAADAGAATETTKPAEDEKERPDAGGAAPAPAGVATEATGDGGTRLSPLTPAPAEMPGSAPVVPADAGTIDYDKLLSDLAALRTRVAAVGESLFQSRMAIALRVDGDRSRVAKVTISVDDGVVYTSPQGFKGDDTTPVFARALAPGRHAVAVDVEREDKENQAFKSAQRSRVIVEVPRDEQLDIDVRVEDDSTMGDLPSKKNGQYDLRVRVKANSHAIKR